MLPNPAKKSKKSKNEQKRAKMRKNSGRSLFPTSLHEEVIPFRTSAKHFVPGTAYQTLQPNTTVPLGRHTRVPATNKACDTSSHKELVLLFFFGSQQSLTPYGFMPSCTSKRCRYALSQLKFHPGTSAMPHNTMEAASPTAGPRTGLADTGSRGGSASTSWAASSTSTSPAAGGNSNSAAI